MDIPKLQPIAGSPYWEYTETRPPEYEVEDNIVSGGAISPSTAWDIWYEGLVLPNLDLPAWTQHLNGAVTHSCTNGRLTIADDTVAEYLYYTYDMPSLSNTIGTYTDIRVKIDSSTDERNKGACLSISDGTYQFMVWLRSDGLNIDGEPKVDIDLSQWRRIGFYTCGTDCEIFVDGYSQQTGMRMDLTTNKQVAFGSWVPSTHVSRVGGVSVSHWDWLRVRGMDDYLSVEEFAMALNSVSATYYLQDFCIGDYQIVQWYHADETVDGASTAKATFEGADVLWSTESNGFLIEWLSSGTNENQVLFKVTYLGTELVMYDEIYPRQIYGENYLSYMNYFDRSGTTGNGEVTLSRRGQLADAAYA